MITYSIIIPHHDIPQLLLRLLATCPTTEDTEVIIGDDHSCEETLAVLRGASLAKNVRIVSVPERMKGAGAARNTALREAQGKWLIFADADDYFLPDMKRIIDSHKDDDVDLIYFHTTSVNTDTGEEGTREKRFNRMIDTYMADPTEANLNALRYGFTPPWSKMIRRGYIARNGIIYDEVKASNDIMFSILAAHSARTISAQNEAIYCVTENSFGLTKTFSKEAWYARFDVALRANKFMRSVGMGKHQYCIPMQSFKASQYGLKDLCKIIGKLIKFRQNPFAGLRRKMKEEKDN